MSGLVEMVFLGYFNIPQEDFLRVEGWRAYTQPQRLLESSASLHSLALIMCPAQIIIERKVSVRYLKSLLNACSGFKELVHEP